MKAIVDQEACIGCGMCIDICPEVFAYDDNSKSETIVDEVPEASQDKSTEAKEICPVDAIKIED